MYPICNDDRDWCAARLEGRCVALTEVYEKGEICPFYKRIGEEDEKKSKKNEKKCNVTNHKR